MSQVIWDEMTESPGELSPTGTDGGPLPYEQRPPKLKGRKRLLQSLQRISSSPSLARIGRTPSSSYTGTGKGSMSCVSLASSSSRYGHSSGPSYSSTQSSAGFSIATSVATTPGPDSQFFDPNARIRFLDSGLQAHGSSAPKSVGLPSDMRSSTKDAIAATTSSVAGVLEDYFAKPIVRAKDFRKRRNFSFWGEMPQEIAVHILQYLKPKEIVKSSLVSKAWYKMCFDGQLWINLDTQEYYQDIPAASLTKIMTKAGPFVKALNLRGCAQMPEIWGKEGANITDVCKNLEYFSLEGCRIDRSSVHTFLLKNRRLVHINLCGMKGLSNTALRIIAQSCEQLEYLNISWCQHVDTRGLLRIVQSCPRLRDLRAGEVKGFDDKAFLLELFNRNTLERLVLSHCTDLDDEGLRVLIQGEEPEINPLTERAMVPPRNFRHLDLSRCAQLTDTSVKSLAYNVPTLCGLQLSHCEELTDDALAPILESTPLLTHLDIEELDNLSNTSLQNLARSPCATKLQHLNISFCENLGDTGMLQVVKSCPQLRTLYMDNTRVSDLVLTEAAAQRRARDRVTPVVSTSPPIVGLHMVIYDCQNVTWTGVREVLSRNAEPDRHEVISLKCFYGYQDTVNEHMKRVLRGDAKSAACLERKWAEYMVASEEAGAQGAGTRRRRRRLREAAMVHADEEEGGPRGGRRRARSGGCAVM
jgi:F-box/leucine-rich repeat protein 2/20